MYTCVFRSSEDGVGPAGAGVKGCCESLATGAGT